MISLDASHQAAVVLLICQGIFYWDHFPVVAGT